MTSDTERIELIDGELHVSGTVAASQLNEAMETSGAYIVIGDEMAIDGPDFRTETYRHAVPDAQPDGIRIVHIPTGLTATAHGHANQTMDMAMAQRSMADKLTAAGFINVHSDETGWDWKRT